MLGKLKSDRRTTHYSLLGRLVTFWTVFLLSLPTTTGAQTREFLLGKVTAKTSMKRLLAGNEIAVGRVYERVPELVKTGVGDSLIFNSPNGTAHKTVVSDATRTRHGNLVIKSASADATIIAVVTRTGDFFSTVRANGTNYESVILDGATVMYDGSAGELAPNPFYSDNPTLDGFAVQKGGELDMLASETTNVISVGVLVDTNAANAYDELALIDFFISVADQSYQDSGVAIDFNVVAIDIYDPYLSQSDMALTLEDVTCGSTGCNPFAADNSEVIAWRDANKADLLVQIVRYGTTGGTCGIAWTPGPNGALDFTTYLEDLTYSVTALELPSGTQCPSIVMAHEMGHNFGLGHDRSTGCGNPFFSYACGYKNSGQGFGSVMSYVPSSQYVYGLSNPNRLINGYPLGVPIGQTSEAFAAQAVADVDAYHEAIYDNGSSSSSNTSHTVTPSASAGGIISPDGPVTVTNGDSTVFTITPDSGYQTIEPVGGTCSGSLSGTTYTTSAITASCSVSASFGVSLAAALDAPELTWSTGGDASWVGQTADFYSTSDNDDAAQSGDIGDNQSTYIETTVAGPGTISFYWKVSSESDWDFLKFFVDGLELEEVAGISGLVDWTQVTYEITEEGNHPLRWAFVKDGSVSENADAAWVDLVTWTTATPNAPTLISVETEQTTSLTGSATVSFSPAATGPVADSYVATCTPQSANRRVSSQVRLSGDVPTAEEFAALTSRPSKAEADALKQLHQSETFRDSGARCGTEAINSRNSNIPRTTADCTNSLTVIKSSYEAPTDDTYVIPIVWHVIYKTDTAQTGLLSAEDIADQIDALNEDYAGFLGAGVDTKIQFVLEDIKYYENDAAYDDTSTAAYDLKDQNKVDGTHFLNVFSNDAQGNLGYAWFPVWGVGTSGDFVTMNAAYVGGRSNGAGVFDEGRTLVHEIGHYLGLIHTFGDDETCGGNTYSSSDLIVDTPEQKSADYSQASSDCGVTSAINNFMNYSYDDLMYTFTEEQTNRMICSLQNYRSEAYELVSDGPTAVTVTATGTTSPIVVPDLIAGATYQCSVAAVAGTQESASSSSGTITAGDRDGDGVLDYDDAFPNDPTETTDTDGEGLGDNLEGTLGTDPENPDTDGDGYTDYEEYVDGTDPLDDGDPGSGGLPIWLLYEATQ